MSLQGSLRTMSFEDILLWIDRRFACGTLSVQRGHTRRFFQFDSGYITGAGSNEPSEHLGQILMNRGLVDERQLNEAFEVQGDTGVLLGKILIMVGAVDEAQLQEVLEEKVSDSICDTLTWNEGQFRFDRTPDDEGVPGSVYEISVSLRATLEEGARRAQLWTEIRELVPDDDVILEIADRELLYRDGDGDARRAEIARLASVLDRGLTVNQVVLELNGRRFHVISRLAELVERGGLRAGRPRATPRPGVERAAVSQELEGDARRCAAAGDRAGGLELARIALDRDPENRSLQTLCHELERALFAELSRDFLSTFRVPRLLKSLDELEGLDLTDTERYLAGRIDGRWDLLSLMRISPLREVEALITFKRLADRGIISL